MLTANFYNMQEALLLQRNIDKGFVDTGGTVQRFYHTGSRALLGAALMNAVLSSTSSAYVRFGTGTTKPAASDYRLESYISSGLTITNPTSVLPSRKSGCLEFSATYALQNTSDADIVISEVGAFVRIAHSTNSNGDQLANAMVDRTVLDAPITIKPNETKQVTYTIRLNYPTA